MKGALQGIKILDLSQGWAGPGATMLLAEQGAEVIKVEPIHGDQARYFFVHPAIHGEDPSFLAMNRSKRGLAVDLKKEEGKKILYRLVENADVLVHNFRSGVAERLQIHYEKVSQINPQLIYVPLNSYGKTGPFAGQPAYDMAIQAMGGAMHRRLPDGTPMETGIWVTDSSTAIMMAYSISLALLARERTGLGQEVEMVLFNQTLIMQLPDLVCPKEPEGKSEDSSSLVDSILPYRCRDGEYIVQVALTDDQFKKLCAAMGLERLVQDPRFNNNVGRAQNGKLLREELVKEFIKRPREEWLERFKGADIPYAPVLRREEVFDHPQALANEMIVEIHHPTAGPLKMLGIPFRLSKTPGEIQGPSPLLGQHTREILGELGYSEQEVEGLKTNKVIGCL
jgi:crotonobetainyl-CoA:carnitine CoA-transferase CaiB-like acyl-CoA transferase